MKRIGMLLWVSAVFMLASCGGSGGHDSNGGVATSSKSVASSSSELSTGNALYGSVSVEKAELSFSGRIGSVTPEAVRISGNIKNAKKAPYVFVDTTSTNLVEAAYSEQINNTLGHITIIPASPDKLQPGENTGIVRVNVCEDYTCTRHLSGSPVDIQIKYDVTAPEFQVSPASISFNIYEGQSLPSQELVLTSPETPYFNWGAIYSSEKNWFKVTSPGLTVAVTENLPPGIYTGMLRVYAFSEVIAKPVPISLTVNKLPVQINDLLWNLNVDALAFDGSESKVIEISSASQTPVSWAATSDVEWLTVNQTSGTATSIESVASLQINEKVLELRSGEWIGNVKFQGADLSVPPTIYTVKLVLNKPEISAVAPATGLAGQTYKVNVYGKNIAAHLNKIRVNGQTPSSITNLSDDVLQLEIPTMASGSYNISFGNNSINYPGYNAEFTAKSNTNNLPEAQLSLAGLGLRSVLDVINDQLYVVSYTSGYSVTTKRLQKLYLLEGVWTLKDLTVENCNVSDIQLSPDASELALVCDTYEIAFIDTQSFTVKGRKSLAGNPDIWDTVGIAYKNNVELFVGSRGRLLVLDTISGKFSRVPGENVDTNLYSPRIFGTADLSSFYLLQQGVSPAPWAMRFSSLDQLVHPTNLDQQHYGYESATLDGKWLILGAGIYDSNMQYRGNVGPIRKLALTGDIGWGFNFWTMMIESYSVENVIANDYTPIRSIPFTYDEGGASLAISLDNKRLFVIIGSTVSVIKTE